MWKCVSIVSMCLGCLYLVTLEVWKCENVEICLHCLILSNNSGSVEELLAVYRAILIFRHNIFCFHG